MKCLLIALAVLLFPSFALAGNDAISTNGFTCTVSGESMTCEGSFPKVPGTFRGIASRGGFVTVGYEKDGVSYEYSASNGCLVRFDKNGSWAKNKNGDEKSFPVSDHSLKDLIAHCAPDYGTMIR
jgi:hypothetical protein